MPAYVIPTLIGATSTAILALWMPPLSLAIGLGAPLLVAALVALRQSASTTKHPAWWTVMPCYLSVQNRDLRIIDANDLFRHDFGSRLGEHCYGVYKGRDMPCAECPVLKTFQSGENHVSEEVVFTRNGEEAHVVVTSTPIRDRWGDIAAVVEMSTNVTKLVKLHRELDRSKREFRLLFDSVPCYISVQDRDFRITDCNDLFRSDFGERVGDHCYAAYKGRARRCPDCPVERTFADGRLHTSEEKVLTRDGRWVNTVVSSSPIRNEKGEVTAALEVSTNVTEVKRLQSLATVGLAVSGLAHRIKNVLMGLKGGVFVANTGMETSDQAMVKEGWEMVERNVEKVGAVATHLLFCSKEREPTLVQDVEPKSIVRDVHDLYRARAESADIELRLELCSSDMRGYYDPDGLQNLVTNLVANALDACRFDPAASEKDHVITLRCFENAAGGMVIEVEDNGEGIPDRLKSRVLEGFFSTKGTEGTGLGLMVVQRVVEEHRGTFDITSSEGVGSTVRVEFPPQISERTGADAQGQLEGASDPQEHGGSHEQEGTSH